MAKYKTIFEIGPIGNYVGDSRKTRDLWGSSFLFAYLMANVAKNIEILGNNVEFIVPHLDNDKLFNKIKDTSSAKVFAGTVPDTIIFTHDDEGLPKEKIEEQKILAETVKGKFDSLLIELFDDSLKAMKKRLNEEFSYKIAKKNSDKEKQEKNYDRAIEQINKYFRLKFISIEGDKISNDDLKKASASYSRMTPIRCYKDKINVVQYKKDKCSLCGDRSAVIHIKSTLSDEKDEQLCGICTIKRGFLNSDIVDKLVDIDTAFKSTTNIAAKYVKMVILESIKADSEFVLKLYEFLMEYFLPKYMTLTDDRYKEFDEDDEFIAKKLLTITRNDEKKIIGSSAIGDSGFRDLMLGYFKEYKKLEDNNESTQKSELDKFLNKLPYQYIFEDKKETLAFRSLIYKELDRIVEAKKELKVDKKNLLPQHKTWINNSYYAIVKADGDSTGSLFEKYSENSSVISEAISEFADGAKEIINDKYNGMLIYAGGEDLLFIIHPSDVLDAIKELNAEFHRLIQKALGDSESDKDKKFSISAGVYICKHKHPLKLAIKGAETLEGKAKHTEKDKNGKDVKGFTAVNLVKGEGEQGEMMVRNFKDDKYYSIEEFKELLDNYKEKSIPRGFLYKLIDEQNIFSEILENEEQLETYIANLFDKNTTFPKEKKKAMIEHIQKISKKSWKLENGKLNYNDLIERLYMARFLTGGLE